MKDISTVYLAIAVIIIAVIIACGNETIEGGPTNADVDMIGVYVDDDGCVATYLGDSSFGDTTKVTWTYVGTACDADEFWESIINSPRATTQPTGTGGVDHY